MNILRQQAVTISIFQRVVEHFAGLLPAAEIPQHVDQPEPADEKGGFRQAEIILARVTHNVLIAQKFAFDRIDRTHETRIVGFDEPDLGQQQHAGVEIVDCRTRR